MNKIISFVKGLLFRCPSCDYPLSQDGNGDWYCSNCGYRN